MVFQEIPRLLGYLNLSKVCCDNIPSKEPRLQFYVPSLYLSIQPFFPTANCTRAIILLSYEFIQKYRKLFVAHFADGLCFIIFTTEFISAMFV